VRELWYDKYRPDNFKDYIWSTDAISKQITDWETKGLSHVILHGPSGTGKTTLALLLANTYTDDMLFVRASVNNTIDFIRNDVTDFCSNAGWDGIQVVIFDEAERLTKDAQEALRNVMDTFGSSVRFIFTCNEVRRIRDAIKSRAQIVEVKELQYEEFALHLLEIAISEGVAEESEDDISIIEDIVSEHYPDMRKSIDMLQACSLSGHIKPISATTNESEDQATELLELIRNNSSINTIRNVVSSMNNNEIEDFYRVLGSSVNSFVETDKDEGELIKIVCKYLYQHSTIAFPDINLLASLVEITEYLHG